jgi:hypothetical protein
MISSAWPLSTYIRKLNPVKIFFLGVALLFSTIGKNMPNIWQRGNTTQSIASRTIMIFYNLISILLYSIPILNIWTESSKCNFSVDWTSSNDLGCHDSQLQYHTSFLHRSRNIHDFAPGHSTAAHLAGNAGPSIVAGWTYSPSRKTDDIVWHCYRKYIKVA